MVCCGLAFIGALIAFIENQILAGVLCILTTAVLSLSFVEYTCTRHYFPTRTHQNPIAELPVHAPPITVTVSQP